MHSRLSKVGMQYKRTFLRDESARNISRENFATIAINLVMWFANLPLSISPDTAAHVDVSSNAYLLWKIHFLRRWYCGKKQIIMWLNVVCTLIDNDNSHHSGQNLLWAHSIAPRESTIFWPLRWRVFSSIIVQTTLNHINFLSRHHARG